MDTQIIIVSLIAVIIVLALALAAIGASYNIVFRNYALAKKRLSERRHKKFAKEKLLDEEREALREDLQGFSKEEAVQYQKLLEEIKKQNVEIFTNTLASTKSLAESEIVQFRKNLESRLDAELTRVNREIEEYKTSQLTKIDRQVKQIITDVARKVFPEAIDIDKHEDLVMKALERAKNEKAL